MKLHFIASLQHEPHNGEWKLVYIDEGEVAGRGWGIFERGLKASLPVFEHVWIQSLRFEGGKHDHLPADVRVMFPSGVITDNIIGMASRPALEQIDGKMALTGWFRPATEKMHNLLTMASESGKLDEFGLSVNGDILDDAHIAPRKLADGRTIDEVLQIDTLYSTDMVTYPGRGGGFRDMLASAGLTRNPPTPPRGNVKMKMIEQLKALLKERHIAFQDDAPAPLGILASVGITASEGNATPEGMSDDDKRLLESIHAALSQGMDKLAANIMEMVKEPVAASDPTPEPSPEPTAEPTAPVQASDPTPAPDTTRFDRLETKLLLRELLDAEKEMIPAIKQIVASRFEGAIATKTDIAQAIADMKKAVSLSSDSGRGTHYTAGSLAVLASANDKVQQVCDRIFGVRPDRFKAALTKLEEVQGLAPQAMFERYGVQASQDVLTSYTAPRMGIRQLYVDLTGDANISFDFNSHAGRTRLLEASTIKQTTLPYAVGVSLNRRLIQDWMFKELPWRKLCRVNTAGLKDFRPQEIIRVAGWSGWRDVAEGDSYLELDVPTEIKETYTPSKKGELLPITREMFMRDDVRLTDTLLMNFRLAGQNTFNKAFFRAYVNYSATLNGGTMGDGNPVYDADNHANLKDAAVTHANMLALKKLIRSQKAEGSDIWMQLQGRYVVVPLSLEDQNLVYVVSERVPDDVINNANILRIKEEDIIVVDDALLESSKYIYMSVDPTDYPTMEVGFINNQQVPEILVQNDPTMGNAFLKDTFTWKGRHEFGIGWEDYRGVARLGTE